MTELAATLRTYIAAALVMACISAGTAVLASSLRAEDAASSHATAVSTALSWVLAEHRAV